MQKKEKGAKKVYMFLLNDDDLDHYKNIQRYTSTEHDKWESV